MKLIVKPCTLSSSLGDSLLDHSLRFQQNSQITVAWIIVMFGFLNWDMRMGVQAPSLSKAQPLPIHSSCWIQACFLALWIEHHPCQCLQATGCHPIIGNYVQMIAQRQFSLNGFSFCVGWGKRHRQDPEQACQKGLEEKCFFWFSRVVSLSWVNEARADWVLDSGSHTSELLSCRSPFNPSFLGEWEEFFGSPNSSPLG